MLALADQHGEVQGSIPGLAHIAGVSLEGCKRALEKFQSPDPYSRTKDHEGRRVEEIDGGWSLLNYAKYRKMSSKDDQMQKSAERSKRYRERKASAVVTPRHGPSRPVTRITPEAEGDVEERVPLVRTNGHSPLQGDLLPGPSPAPVDSDLGKVIFGQGLDWLMATTKKNRQQCATMLGKWRKELANDDALISMLGRAQREGIIEPLGWIQRAVATHRGQQAASGERWN